MMRTYTLDPNLSTEDAMLVAAAKNARDAGKIAEKAYNDFVVDDAPWVVFQVLQAARDRAESVEMMLAGLAGYVDGYPEHVIAAIEAD